MLINSLLVTAALALGAPNTGPSAALDEPQVNDCKVVSIEDQEVPGSEAGVLMSLEAKEGMLVRKGMELGRTDDREAQAQREIKKLEFAIADQKAKSDITIRYADKAAEVAKTIFAKAELANEKSKNTVAGMEVLKLKLEWEKSVLGIEKEKETQIEAQLTADGKQAEVKASDIAIDRRILRAPFDGVVVKVNRHVGEWVAPGDKVMRIVRVDRLRVLGNLDATQYGPGDVEGRRVTVEVTLQRGRTVKVPGKVVFASPVVGVGLTFPVCAEIDNPIEDGRPVVRAGLDATMTIHLKEPLAAETRPVSRKTALQK